MNEHLLNWLNGSRNYTIGTILYGQFGNDESIKNQLAAGRNKYSENLLLDSINALVKGEEQRPPAPVISSYDVMPDDGDSVLKSLKDRWMPMYTEMNYKRHALDKLLDDPFEKSGLQRAQLAKEILDLEQQCMAVWNSRSYYQKHNSLPGKSIEQEIIVEPFKAAERKGNLKIYIRRYKNQLSKSPGNAEAANLLKKYTDELTAIEKAHG